jgi:hypothetical protein
MDTSVSGFINAIKANQGGAQDQSQPQDNTSVDSFIQSIKSNQQDTDTPQGDPSDLSDIPTDVRNASELTGKDYDSGYCESFVEQAAGIQPQGATALDAWNNFVQNGKAYQNANEAPAGSFIYFNDPNQPDGHVGISEGNGNFISATYNGVREDNLQDWEKQTGQQPLGYAIPQ